MRLNLLFIVMYLLTLLAYPIVFVHGKLRRFQIQEKACLRRTYPLLFIPSQAGPMTNWM